MQNLYLVTLLDCMLAKMFRAKISRINLLLSKFCLATSTNLILTSLSLMGSSLVDLRNTRIINPTRKFLRH